MKNLSLFILILFTCIVGGTNVHAATTLQKAIQPQPTSLKPSTASSTSGETTQKTDANTLISNEILRLCKQPSGCEIVVPTEADREAIKNDPIAQAFIQDFATDLSQGVTPSALVLAAIDPNNSVLVSVLPEFASRLSQLSRIGQNSIDPRTGLGDLQNPNVGFRQVITIGAGPNGPTYTVSQRSAQFGDPVRANLSFISEGQVREIEVNKGVQDAEERVTAENEKILAESGVNREVPAPPGAQAPESGGGFVGGYLRFYAKIFEFFGVLPSRSDQSPDAPNLGGPQISTQQILDANRPQVIDPADAIQNVDLTNRIPTGSVVDPEQDSTQSTIVIPIAGAIQAKTLDGRIIPLDQGSGLTNGTFVEGETTLQADRCDAAGNCN